MKQPKPTIQCTWAELHEKAELFESNTVKVEDLGRYGLDSEIINSMVECEIFPQTYLVRGDVLVSRDSILSVINQLLKNEMRLFRDHVKADEIAEEVSRYMENHKVKLTDEVIAEIKDGKVTVAEAIANAIEAQKSETTEETSDAQG